MGAVEEDAHRRAVRLSVGQPVRQRGLSRQVWVIDAVRRHGHRRRVAEPGAQEPVGQVPQEVLHVLAPPGLEVSAHALQHVRRHGRRGRKFRVRRAGAADQQQRGPVPARVILQHGEGRHLAQAAQNAHHDNLRRVVIEHPRHGRHVGLRGQGHALHRREPLRKPRQRVVKGQDVRIRVGKEQDATGLFHPCPSPCVVSQAGGCATGSSGQV